MIPLKHQRLAWFNLFLFFWIGSLSILTAQNTGVYKKLYYNIYISNSNSTDFLENTSIHKSTLHSLKSFYDEHRVRPRSKAYALARSIYDYSDDKTIRQRIVEDHLQGCLNDRSPSLRAQLANHLLVFEKEDFSETAVELIRELISSDPNKKHYIVIAGYKGLEGVLPHIGEMSDEEVFQNWDIISALARIGDPEALSHCLKVIREHPVNMKFFNELLPGLAFTTDKSVFDAIIEEILDDNTALIGTRLKDYQRYYMMRFIIPLIKEYPYKFVEEGQLTEDEFYEQLHFAMDWLNSNKHQYSLVTYEHYMESKSSPFLSEDFSLF